MSAARALVVAQLRASSNRLRVEAGEGGAFASGAVVVLVVAIVGFPAALTFMAGADLGDAIRSGTDRSALVRWNALQSLFVVAFGLLGALRYVPGLRRQDVGHLPVRGRDLLVAELPAALIEVFPLLAVAGIVASGLGLASRMPARAPAIALLGIAGVATMFALLFAGAAAKRWVIRRGLALPATAAGAALVIAILGVEGARSFVRRTGPAALEWLPGSLGYRALLSGQAPLPAAAAILGALVAAFGLLALAAWTHHRTIHSDMAANRVVRRRRPFVFSRPWLGVARLSLTQILDSQGGRLGLVAPLLFTGPIALAGWLVRRAVTQERVLPEQLLTLEARIDEVPVYTILAFVIVALDGNQWMNQFGLDRRGVATLLQLPLRTRDLLRGKLAALVGLLALQFAIGAGPLVIVATPSAGLLGAAFAAGGLTLLLVTAAGHLVSARFPRAVDPAESARVPLHLTLLQSAMMVGSVGLVGGVWVAATRLGVESSVALPAVLAVALLGYARALPRLALQVAAWREHLLRM